MAGERLGQPGHGVARDRLDLLGRRGMVEARAMAAAIGAGAAARQACPNAAAPLMAAFQSMRSGGRVVEGARLESEYTAKPYRGFESLPLRHIAAVALERSIALSRRDLVDLEAQLAQLLAEDGPHRIVVVDQQDRLGRGGAGRPGLDASRPWGPAAASRAGSARSSLPSPACCSMRSLPPDCWTKPATIDRPRPVPLPASLVVKKGSVIRLTMSPGRCPGPGR
jgi:hypothetical protein